MLADLFCHTEVIAQRLWRHVQPLYIMPALTQTHPRSVVLRKSTQALWVKNIPLFCDLRQFTDTPATVRQALEW